MAGFVKLDCAIVDSSLWVERDHRSLFITALVMAEPYELEADAEQIEVDTLDLTGWVVPKGWYGLIRAASTGIIRRDGMEPEAGKVALRALCAPDPHSRSQDFDGRRMARVDGGYIVLNYFKYRDRDYGAAERMRKLRARKKASVTGNATSVTDGDVTANVTQAESRKQSAKADAEKEGTTAFHRLRSLVTSGDLRLLQGDQLAWMGDREKAALKAVGGLEAIKNKKPEHVRFMEGDFVKAFCG